MGSLTFTGTARPQATSLTQLNCMVKGRLRNQWFTSMHPQAKTIHEVDPLETKFLYVEDRLIVKVKAKCFNEIVFRNLLTLTDQEAYAWMLSRGEHFEKFGRRKQCDWCARV